MISKEAVQAFLRRPLEDYAWLKFKPKRGVLKRIARMGNRQHLFRTMPYRHQVVCFFIGICVSRFLFLLDMGLGKTKIVLDIFEYKFNNDEATRALVLVPNKINVDGWREEIELHSRMRFQGLLGSTKEKWQKLEDEADIYVVHYSGLVHMVTTKAKVRGQKKNKLRIDSEAIEVLGRKFDYLVLDEIHKVKNHRTVIYAVLNKLSPMIPFVYGMTGTPFGKQPENLWPQFHIVDRGETLGDTLGMFREAFFDMKFGYGGHRKYVLRKDMQERLHIMIQNRSIRYEDKECSDMPERIDIPIPLTLTIEQMAYYKPTHATLTDAMRTVKKDRENGYHQLRQICSGFVKWKDESDQKAMEVLFKENPKLEAIESLALELPESRKMVIFHEYIYSGRMIATRLRSLKLDCAEVRGEIKDPIAEVRKFKENSKCRFLVANIAAGSVGGNYQIANTVVFFESPSGPIARTQAEKRCTGARQKEYDRVYVYDLIVRDTVEEDIQDSLADGRDLFESLVNGKANISVPRHV